MDNEQMKKWYLMASGTMFMAYVANLGAKLLKANKSLITAVTFIGLMAGATVTSRMIDKDTNSGEE